MKVYIMTDMEGVAGMLNFPNWCLPPERGYPGRYYDLGRELLTREVNAAVEGLFQGGVDKIIVSDGHGPGGINPMLLDPRAELLRGWPSGWPLELDDTFDAVAWVGQHAKAGTRYAHLAHTQSLKYIDQSINGVSVGEFGQFALCASELGIPAIFGSGDAAFCKEAMALIPGIVTVAVKRGVQPQDGRDLDTKAYMAHNRGAIHLHPTVARKKIREGAKEAMFQLRTSQGEYGIVKLDPPYERVTIFRPDEPGQPKRIDRATHPTSIAGVLNEPFDPQAQ